MTTVPLSCLPSDPFLEGRTCAPPPSKNRRLSCITSDSHPLPSPLFSPLCVLLLRRPRSSYSSLSALQTRLYLYASGESRASALLSFFTPLHRVGFREGHLAGGNRRRTRTSSAEQAGPEQNPHWARFFPSFTTRVPALPSCDPLLVSNPTFGLLQDEFFPPGNSYPSLSQVLKNRRMLRNRG